MDSGSVQPKVANSRLRRARGGAFKKTHFASEGYAFPRPCMIL